MFKSLKKEFSCMLLFFSLLIIVVMIGITYFMFRKNLINRYSFEANNIANLVADALDGDDIYRYATTLETDENYDKKREELVQIKENLTDIAYMYVVVPVSDTEEIYVYDIYTQAEYDAGTVDEGTLGYVEAFSEEMLGPGRDIYYSNEDNDELQISKTAYGYLASAYAPIYGKDGKVKAIVGLDYRMQEINAMIRNFIIAITVGMIVVTIFAALFMISMVSKSLVQPICMMGERAAEFAASEHESSASDYHITVSSQNEIHNLADALNKMMDDIDYYIEDIQKITAEKERISAELNVATEIQAGMLPSIFPAFPERKEFDLYATMDPAKEVGGDFYDFFMVDEDHLAIVIADVSGKGVPAALFMVIAKTLIKNVAQDGKDIGDIFSQVNGQLCEGNEAEMFVTAWIGVLEISTGRIVYADAGHENPILCRKEGSVEIVKPKRKRLPLAAWEGIKYPWYEFELEHGDLLFLYTDGAPEATNAQNELFGMERLMDSVTKNSAMDCKTILNNVNQDITEFVGDADQFDDLTMLAFRYI